MTERGTGIDGMIASLATRDPVKVWSWLTTVFGDLARQPGDELSGAVLGALSARIGIRPEAVRTALHRLRKEGWITARKEGRGSLYCLSARAAAETRAASARIYARRIERADRWHLWMPGPDAGAHPGGEYLSIGEGVWLGAGMRPVQCGEALAVDLAAGDLPLWVMRGAVPEDVVAAFARLEDDLAGIDPAGAGAVLDNAALRLLVLHHWRRAVLKCPAVAEVLAGEDWSGARCRKRVAGLLDALPAPAPGTLE